MRTAYNILFTVFFVLSSPYYFWRMQRRGNWVEGFLQRFGIYDTKLKQALTNRQTIWLHAVSVGEVNICTQLIRALEPRLPNVKIKSQGQGPASHDGGKPRFPALATVRA